MSKRKRRWDTAQLAAGSKRLIDRVPAWAAGEGALVAVFLVLAVAAAFVPRPQPLPDFGAIEQVAERKQAFFEYMTPLVETENGRIQKERRQLLKIAGRLANDRQPSILDRNRLAHLAVKYDLSWPVDDWSEALSTLLRRVDTVPAGLVLAQAAEESGWGRSRFARQGHNLVGERRHGKGGRSRAGGGRDLPGRAITCSGTGATQGGAELCRPGGTPAQRTKWPRLIRCAIRCSATSTTSTRIRHTARFVSCVRRKDRRGMSRAPLFWQQGWGTTRSAVKITWPIFAALFEPTNA